MKWAVNFLFIILLCCDFIANYSWIDENSANAIKKTLLPAAILEKCLKTLLLKIAVQLLQSSGQKSCS